MSAVITYRGKYLSAYHFNGFANGVKEAFRFRKDSCLLFDNKQDAENKIREMHKDLDEWINVDIQKQAKNWSDETRDEFLKESFITYEKLKKIVSKFKIIEELEEDFTIHRTANSYPSIENRVSLRGL